MPRWRIRGKKERRKSLASYNREHDLERRLKAAAHRQFIIGMDRDEVYAEMMHQLFIAWESYRPDTGVPFDAYFFATWQRRRVSLIRRVLAQKRAAYTEPIDEDAHEAYVSYTHEYHNVPEPPKGTPEEAKKVWDMLAQGYDGKEVRQELGISIRRFYKTLDSFATDEVVRILRNQEPDE